MHPIVLCLPLTACLAQAQPPESSRARPLSPILVALDKDQDGIISAAEIANASAALKTLDKNGDGKLTPDEYRPARPEGPTSRPETPRPEVEGQDRGPNLNGDAIAGEPKDRTEAPSSQPQRPRPLLDTVLDEDGDEIISAAEIAKAPTLLKKLDLNGDGKLTRDEYAPRPMQRDNATRSNGNG